MAEFINTATGPVCGVEPGGTVSAAAIKAWEADVEFLVSIGAITPTESTPSATVPKKPTSKKES